MSAPTDEGFKSWFKNLYKVSDDHFRLNVYSISECMMFIDNYRKQLPPSLTLQECKDAVAKKHGFKDWEAFTYITPQWQVIKALDEVFELGQSNKV